MENVSDSVIISDLLLSKTLTNTQLQLLRGLECIALVVSLNLKKAHLPATGCTTLYALSLLARFLHTISCTLAHPGQFVCLHLWSASLDFCHVACWVSFTKSQAFASSNKNNVSGPTSVATSFQFSSLLQSKNR